MSKSLNKSLNCRIPANGHVTDIDQCANLSFSCALPIWNVSVRNRPISWPPILLVAAFSRVAHPNNWHCASLCVPEDSCIQAMLEYMCHFGAKAHTNILWLHWSQSPIQCLWMSPRFYTGPASVCDLSWWSSEQTVKLCLEYMYDRMQYLFGTRLF